MSALVATLKTDIDRTNVTVRPLDPQPSSVKQDELVKDSIDTEPTLSIYERIKGEPYTAKFFKIKDWDVIDDERDKVDFIERFVSKAIKRNNLEDTTASYDDLIEHYLEEINARKTETNDSKFQRLFMYLDILEKQRRLDQRRRSIIGKPSYR